MREQWKKCPFRNILSVNLHDLELLFIPVMEQGLQNINCKKSIPEEVRKLVFINPIENVYPRIAT